MMANAKNSSIKSKNEKSQVKALPQLRVVATRIQQTTVSNRSDNRETWCLLWKKKCDRREIIVLVCFLSQEGDRQLKDYQETVDNLKLEAKKSGCTCLTDMLDIVKIKREYQDQALWRHQFFDNDQLSDINQYQLVHFGLDSDGKKKYFQFSCKISNDTEWSLILHLMNNCNSIEEIVRSGKVPDNTSNNSLKLSPENSATIIDNRVINNDSETSNSLPGSFFFSLFLWIQKFFSNNSITILHFRNLNSMRLSSISMVRCTQAFFALTNCFSDEKRKSERNNSHCCDRCLKPNLIPSQIKLSKERVARWNAFLSALFDMLLGFVMGAALLFVLYNHQNVVKAFNFLMKRKAFQYLEDHIVWLETFPAGFKLNVQLTHTMGYGIRTLLDHHKGFLFATIWDPRVCQDYLVPTLATIAALGGWTTFLALLVDLWRLEIIHVTFFAICFRKFYQAELYLLSALFRLFRGKKRNNLRQRTDSMKYDIMQLLMGTIAFCVCVFLWTTVMVYYTFFVIWNLLMHLPLMGFSVLYLMSRYIPFGSLFFRFSNPHWFPKDLYIKMNDEIKIDRKSSIQVSELESILESSAYIIFSRIKIPLKHLFDWYLISLLEILYPRASRKSHSFLPLTLLVDDAKK